MKPVGRDSVGSPDTDSSMFAPERPGSAPPTLTLNSTNLFAFGTSSTSGFFSDLRHGDSPVAEEVYEEHNMPTPAQCSSPCLPRSYSVEIPSHHEDDASQHYWEASAISRRKSSIEMFLSQSPSHALGEEYMKMTFDETSRPQSRGYYPSTTRSLSTRWDATSNSQPVRNTTLSRAPSSYVGDRKVAYPVPYYVPATYEPSTGTTYTHGPAPSHHLPQHVVPVPWAAMPVVHHPMAVVGPPIHQRSSLSPRSPPAVKACKFFAQGHCRMGNKCKFLHTGGSIRVNPYDCGSREERKGALNVDRNNRGDALSAGSTPQSSPTSSSSSRGLGEKDKGRRTPLRKEELQEGFPTEVSVEDFQGRVFAMSKDQNGCRLLQEQLEYNGAMVRDIIFEESLEHLSCMMVDPFGNYLFQKLLERVTDGQRTTIVSRVCSTLVAAALNLHGTRSVQKVVEVCSLKQQVSMICAALRKQAVRLCIDSNGNHVIQRALQHMSSTQNQFVFDAVCEACVVVGTHRHGCCVLQRCLDAATPAQKVEVIFQVERHAMHLMQDPYGNYVVQYVLDTCSREEAAGVITKPLGNVAHLSVQKFSSNVIEKCLEKANDDVRSVYLKEIMSTESIRHLLQDQYANYVVQRALSVCSVEQGLLLVESICPHLVAMRNTSGGRRISARILKRFPNVNLDRPDMYGLMIPPEGSSSSNCSLIE